MRGPGKPQAFEHLVLFKAVYKTNKTRENKCVKTKTTEKENQNITELG